MFNPNTRKTVTRVTLGLVACWLIVNASNLAAQSTPPRALVVVAESADAERVRRIGGEHVVVEVLFTPQTSAGNYHACEERVRTLLEFRLYIARTESCCPYECLWRERLSAANPRGELHTLSPSRHGTAFNYDRVVQQTSEIHRALTVILPDQRESLKANLQAEIRRLQSLHFSSPELAVR